MKHLLSISRICFLYLILLVLTLSLSGCGTVDVIDKAIGEINKTRTAIAGESSAWRGELPKLLDKLKGIEGQAAGDVKAILVDATNQVQDLTTQTLNLTEAKTNEILANANAFILCDASFVKDGVQEQLQYLVDDLMFWKQNNSHIDKKPNHQVCVINPSVLSLYQSGNSWSLDTSNMSEQNIMQVYGYNFWPDALPTLELQDALGQTIRDIQITPAYVTHYQVNLDFSNEDFVGMQSSELQGARVVFRWPDQEDPNTINLIVRTAAQLVISDPSTWVFTPSAPTAQSDNVILKVTVTNIGDLRSGNFIIYWDPDPWDNDTPPVEVTSPTPLNSNESREYYLSAYRYRRAGTIRSTVYLSTGDDTQSRDLVVAEPQLSAREQTIHWEERGIQVTDGDNISKMLFTMPQGCRLNSTMGGGVLNLSFAQVEIPSGFSLNFLIDNFAKKDITFIEKLENNDEIGFRFYYVKLDGVHVTNDLSVDVTVHYLCPP